MIEIVPFSGDHHAGVIDVILPIQREEFGIPITLADQPDLADIPAFYRRGEGDFWVALDGSRVVGTIALVDIGNRQAALRKMFVRAEYRGRPHQAGRLLLERLLAACRERSILDVYLGTTTSFVAAHRFYEKWGFRLIEKSELPPAFPVMAVDSRFYALSLRTPAPPART